MHCKPALFRWTLVAFVALAAVGCPEPVVENPGDPDGIDEGASTRGVMGQSDKPTAAAGGPGPAAAAPSGAVPDADLDPKHTQEELADGALLKGTLGCEDCLGPLLVRVLPPPPSADAAVADGEGIVLITQKVFPEPGAFEIRVPKDRAKVVLQVVEDSDESGKPSTGERMGLVIDGPITVADLVEDISLTVGVFPEMGSAPPVGGLPPGTEPPGDLPDGEAAAGDGAPAADGADGAPAADGADGAPAGEGAITSGMPPATGAQEGGGPPPALDNPGSAPGTPEGTDDAPTGDQ